MLKKTLVVAALLSSMNAFAGLVVIGNPSMGELDASTVKKLYLGKAKSLQIEAVDLEDGNPAKETFHQAITQKTEAQLQAYWAKRVFTGKGQPPKAVAQESLAKDMVASSSNTIAYIDESLVDSSVKVILKL
ncbi:phosphate ABC transporter substrate-binding protein [Vibrio gigantis]|uniref:Phosphate ABC transporter substrate-binding protein n=1 Tax=Vibrio gigantis TaxID=296199 RepID=A0A5M9NZ36_9VIBR|nr:phosphate ABC transporter substrate-binding protein [Vibrio gigantis]KAA8677203.1 phosphate ABC transporter substrate-binding protein [Vibrio gigantis]ULN63226.1 phosphate ABC transporter substrate-binding protein [Vibrio gigantis]